MSKALVNNGYQQAKTLLLIQLGLLILVASIGLLKEFKVAIALLSGGMAVFIANCYFVYKAFSKSGAQQSKNVVGAFFLGEAVKMVLSTGLLVAGFIFLPSFEVFVLIGYVAALLSQWLAPTIIKTH